MQQGANHQVQLSSLEATDSVFVLARDAQCAIEQTNVIQMNIETPLEAPQVNCGNSNDTSIQFTWNAINGAIGYAVSVNGSTFITPSSGLLGTVHQLNGLNPGNIASLTVQAIGSGL